MTLWSLVVCAGRGPGAVGERMDEVTSVATFHRNDGGQSERNLEGGEEAPLMLAEQSATGWGALDASGHPQHRRRHRRGLKQNSRSAGKGHSNHSSAPQEDPEEAGASDHLEMRPSSSSENEDEDEGDDMEASYGPEAGAAVQIIYPSQRDVPQRSDESGAGTLMAKANGKVRFCRKVCALRVWIRKGW